MTTATLSAPATAHPKGGVALKLVLAGAVGVFIALVLIFWVGLWGADDTTYWAGSTGWLEHVPYVGTDHGRLRHTMVIPMAIARRLFGDGMLAMTLPTLLHGIGAILVAGFWMGRVAGPVAAAGALALMVTNPQFVLVSSTADIDVLELFYVLSGFALMQAAMDRPAERVRLLLWAGLLLGLGMLTRETIVFAVVAIGLLFLAGYGMKRAYYFAIGAGFLVPFGLELIYLGVMTGNPLYRASISVHHDSTINRWIPQGAAVPLVHPVIDPFIMLLLNHNFALLFWVGPPLIVWLFRRGALSLRARRLAVLLTTLGVTWILFAAETWKLLPLTPRYFLLPSILVSILSGLALARLWQLGRRRLALGIGLVLVIANIGAVWLDNRNYFYGEHELVDVTSRHQGTIHTDPQTLRRAGLLLEWKGLRGRVTAAPPEPGDLFYHNPTRAPDELRPKPGWIVVEKDGLPETIGQRLARLLLPPGTIPPGIWEKLGRGHPDVTLYRVTEPTG